MQKTDSLTLMPLQEYFAMCARRAHSVAKILDTTYEKSISNFIDAHRKSFVEVKLPPSLEVYNVFDETNAAIGEDWLWDHQSFYFVRETDAIWFRLRWL